LIECSRAGNHARYRRNKSQHRLADKPSRRGIKTASGPRSWGATQVLRPRQRANRQSVAPFGPAAAACPRWGAHRENLRPARDFGGLNRLTPRVRAACVGCAILPQGDVTEAHHTHRAVTTAGGLKATMATEGMATTLAAFPVKKPNDEQKLRTQRTERVEGFNRHARREA